jgi:hypothetical protein
VERRFKQRHRYQRKQDHHLQSVHHNAQGVRQPFAGNIIPQTLLDTPVINVFKGISPVPSGPNATANPWTGLNFQTFYPNTTDTNTITGRVDQVFSDKDSLSVRYTQAFKTRCRRAGCLAIRLPA